MDEKIIEKIRKLLALAGSSNENEAQNAMLKAQELMAKHKIEMTQVQDAPVDHEVIEEYADKKAHRTKWKRALAHCIVTNFNCDLFLFGHGSYQTVFVGKKENIEICKMVYNSAIQFIDINFKLYWNSQGKWDDYYGTQIEKPLSASIRMKDSYARGFIEKLKEKFKEQKVKADKEGWGLVLIKDADVVAHMNNKDFAGRGLGSSPTHIEDEALSQGYFDCENKFGETGQKHIK